MQILSSLDDGICRLDKWAQQLATLTRTSWTGSDGKCYFPYLPLTTEKYWLESIVPQWQNRDMVSWVLVESGMILSHTALVRRNGYYELGRWVSYSHSPKNAVSNLSACAMEYHRDLGLPLLVETTQAHTSSQFICEKLGLRFAGIGFLNVIDGVPWDIIYYDNLRLGDFIPEAGVLGDPLGKKIRNHSKHQQRLVEALETLSSDRNGDLPPTKFHVLPHRLSVVREIFCSNIALYEKV